MPGCLMGSPAANVAPTGTASWITGTVIPAFPAANGLTSELEDVTKATTAAGAAKYRVVLASNQTLVGLLVFHTNFGGLTATLENDGGMSIRSVSVPDTEDGLQQNVIFDLRGVSGTNADTWDIGVTGAGSVAAIGRVVALTAWIEPRVAWKYDIEEEFGGIVHRNSYKKRMVVAVPTRIRHFRCDVEWAEDRDILRSHRRACGGPVESFPLVPDEEDLSDVFLVQYKEDPHKEQYNFHDGSFSSDTVDGEVIQTIQAEEVNPGLALD